MLSNLTPLALDEMILEDISKLDVSDLARLHDEIRDTESAWRERKTKIIDALELRYAARATNILAQEKKIAGTIHFPEAGFDVKRITGLDVKYDQAVLLDLHTRIVAAKQDPTAFMTMEFKVPEAAYKTWRPEVKAEFDTARTLKAKRATYEFEKAK